MRALPGAVQQGGQIPRARPAASSSRASRLMQAEDEGDDDGHGHGDS